MASPTTALQPVRVLLVDDGLVEQALFRTVFERSPSLHLTYVATDGVEAMAFLRHQPPFESARTPDLVLLDITMPEKDGFEVLREMRADPALRKIPVIMLTTSGREEDVNRAYEEGANTLITKPLDFIRLKRAVERFADYWAETARLPSDPDG